VIFGWGRKGKLSGRVDKCHVENWSRLPIVRKSNFRMSEFSKTVGGFKMLTTTYFVLPILLLPMGFRKIADSCLFIDVAQPIWRHGGSFGRCWLMLLLM